MAKRHGMELLQRGFASGKAICVGLDTDALRIPQHNFPLPIAGDELPEESHRVLGFNGSIVDATHDLVVAYKPNSAFYEGGRTMPDLELTIRYIHEVAPMVPVILDAKRGDIDHTNMGYVVSAFDHLRADAITVHPYLGRQALSPFLDRADKAVFVLCRTSNEEGGEFQDGEWVIRDPEEQEFMSSLGLGTHYDRVDGAALHTIPLYLHVAYRVARHWNKNGNCGLVVGATYPEELGQVRRIAPDLPFLIPGIGAQGGDVEATVRNGRDAHGQGMIINSSRGIIYAEVPRTETLCLDGLVRKFATA